MRQVDLFLNHIPLCPFCGYPQIPLQAMRCEYELTTRYPGFDPFFVDWHIDLNKDNSLPPEFMEKLAKGVEEALQARPKILEKIFASRTESWMNRHAIKQRKTHSQVSLIGYIFGACAELTAEVA